MPCSHLYRTRLVSTCADRVLSTVESPPRKCFDNDLAIVGTKGAVVLQAVRAATSLPRVSTYPQTGGTEAIDLKLGIDLQVGLDRSGLKI